MTVEHQIRAHRSLIQITPLLLALALTLVPAAEAGVVVYEEGDKKVEIGGRIHLQFVRVDPDEGEAQNDAFFRRLRPYIAGSVTKNWEGKIQFDFGKSLDDDEVSIKDTYMRYTGWEGKKLTIGNVKTPFSREFLTSSKHQQLVERSFVGDHNFGSPDRFLGFRLDGTTSSKKLGYALALGSESHDPGVFRMDFDTPVDDQSDWNEGLILAGRLDFHPRGEMKFDQGDFDRGSVKTSFSLAAFSWTNDDDRNTYTDNGVATSDSKADLDNAAGFEISAGLRGHGVSIDVEYQLISGDTVAEGFTGGAYQDGTTDLDKLAVEGGYMFAGNHFEIVGGWDMLDASGYEDTWERLSFGVNYFWNKHKTKVQFTYRFGSNVLGIAGADTETTFLQFQYVF